MKHASINLKITDFDLAVSASGQNHSISSASCLEITSIGRLASGTRFGAWTNTVRRQPSSLTTRDPETSSDLRYSVPAFHIRLPPLRRQLESRILERGATVQPTSVQSPRVRADCHAFAGTTTCGRAPASTLEPSRCCLGGTPSSSAIAIFSGAPAYQFQISTASTRCQRRSRRT